MSGLKPSPGPSPLPRVDNLFSGAENLSQRAPSSARACDGWFWVGRGWNQDAR